MRSYSRRFRFYRFPADLYDKFIADTKWFFPGFMGKICVFCIFQIKITVYSFCNFYKCRTDILDNILHFPDVISPSFPGGTCSSLILVCISTISSSSIRYVRILFLLFSISIFRFKPKSFPCHYRFTTGLSLNSYRFLLRDFQEE